MATRSHGIPLLPPSRSKPLPQITKASDGTDLNIAVAPAKGVSFFTPEQTPPAGTALDTEKDIPKIFTPLKIRGIEMQNRIWVSPMCQYSAHEGVQTAWHNAHYGGIAMRGPGLTMIEATAVQARGRITPEDCGLWNDTQAEKIREVVEFTHSQNALVAIQIAHAGRKASTVPPWLSFAAVATKEANGWPDDVIGPSDEPFAAGYPKPRAMTLADIEEVKKDFVAATERAVYAGVDVIEMHFAHGYLVSSFLSPAVNKRTDQYGGSFENRVRLGLEIVEAARAVMPKDMPLFVRVSATDWLDQNPDYSGPSWTVGETAQFALLLAERGVDVLDVSSGGVHAGQKVTSGPGYQAAFAKTIKKAVGDKMLISTVGSVDSATLAESLIAGGKDQEDTPLDLVGVGRLFLKNPGLVWAWADELDTNVCVANQYGWGFGGRAARKKSVKKNLP